MSGVRGALLEHLQSGLTTVCRAWAVERNDGLVLGFTDHDKDLSFEGIAFRADTGMSAAALQQSTGLSVDNTEALGALSDAAITEADIEAGRYDDAKVRSWLVNWADVSMRHLVFAGSFGELKRGDGAFTAELRGLTDKLNRPLGRVYQKPCTAVLGDKRCRFDTNDPLYSFELAVQGIEDGTRLEFADFVEFDEGWFAFGTLEALSGGSSGLKGIIKRDFFEGNTRIVNLWHPMRGGLESGDMIRLVAGCDRAKKTCQLKFNNLINFQGFPDIPGDNWLAVQPVQAGETSGGSRR